MTKNKRRAAPAGLTSQGVRDLNNLGPRQPRPSDEASAAPEVAPRVPLLKYQLNSLYGKSSSLIVPGALDPVFAEDDEP